jgi:hypothetical protein
MPAAKAISQASCGTTVPMRSSTGTATDSTTWRAPRTPWLTMGKPLSSSFPCASLARSASSALAYFRVRVWLSTVVGTMPAPPTSARWRTSSVWPASVVTPP